MSKISAVVLTKNEEEMLPDCLESLSFCSEILIIDSGSTDTTREVAKKYGAKVFEELSDNFAAKRELGLEKAKSEWVLYIDADERVTKELRESLEKVVTSKTHAHAYSLSRKNYFFGTAWPEKEWLIRFFKKDYLKRWDGKIHESPVVDGEVAALSGDIDHYTHRDLSSMLAKTIMWSDTEAELRFKANHPQMTWWRFPRVMIPTFYRSYITQKGWKKGTSGIIEAIFQMFSMFITYAKLWEMQRNK